MSSISLVSIIIPVHNSEAFLDECIKSVLAQSFDNLEIIIVDDDSTDNSATILQKYKRQDSRVKVYSAKKHNAALVRRLGFQKSKGEFICFVDSDDILHQDYVRSLYDTLIKTDTEVASCKIATFTDKPKLAGYQDTGAVKVQDNIFDYFFDNYHGRENARQISQSINAKIFRRGILEKIDYSVLKTSILEDNYISVQFLSNIKDGRIGLVDSTLYFYRVGHESTMSGALLKVVKYDEREIGYIELFEITTAYIKSKFKDDKKIQSHIDNLQIQEYKNIAEGVISANLQLSEARRQYDDLRHRYDDIVAENKKTHQALGDLMNEYQHSIEQINTIKSSLSFRTGRVIIAPIRFAAKGKRVIGDKRNRSS